ncbi:MAG: hypothetical protein M1294_10260 [Firmicutes bacterium]|nr:hypothetical protein [Bacillota bacterium]
MATINPLEFVNSRFRTYAQQIKRWTMGQVLRSMAAANLLLEVHGTIGREAHGEHKRFHAGNIKERTHQGLEVHSHIMHPVVSNTSDKMKNGRKDGSTTAKRVSGHPLWRDSRVPKAQPMVLG